MEDKDIEARLIQLCEGLAVLTEKIDTMQKDIDELKKLSSKVTFHTTQLESIDNSLQRGEKKFGKIEDKIESLDKRIDLLENQDGNKAKEFLTKVASYFLTALLAFVVASIGYYLGS